MASDDAPTDGDADEAQRTERVRQQGAPEGLFRSCMDVIRRSHSVGQALRTAMLGAGLMTDAECYAELLAQFYVCTAALERGLQKSASKLAQRVNTEIGLAFTSGYEADLRHLLGEGWARRVDDELTSDVARRYVARLEAASEAELVAGVFILHGPLAIGGGAALKPRVGKAFGAGATHVFEPVVGPGRGRRRALFITAFDELLAQVPSEDGGAEKGTADPRFGAIVSACGEFMELNNQLMLSCRKRPWWSKWAWGAAVVVVGAAALAYRSRDGASAEAPQAAKA